MKPDPPLQPSSGSGGIVVWLTGLSAAGKTTIAREASSLFRRDGFATCVLDGDDLRLGLCNDLGFSPRDRDENVRRAGEAARLMAEAGLIVFAALISPHRAVRDRLRARVAPHGFLEIHVSTPLETCELRDPKGLYRKARAGELREFTGVSAPYEPPLAPDLAIDSSRMEVAQAAQSVARLVRQRLGLADTRN